MASLIVNLHEIINDYIKNARDKELAGKIASEVLVRSKEVVKKFMFIGEDSCMYHVAHLYPMVSRELLWWNLIARRRMKATTSLAHPWQVIIARNMHEEVFNLLKECVSTRMHCALLFLLLSHFALLHVTFFYRHCGRYFKSLPENV